MDERDPALLRVAETMIDGLAVEWESEKASRPELSGSLDVLRQLDVMAQAHAEPVTETFATHAADARPLRTWGPLQIVEKIGEGGFGDVFRAYDPVLRVDVALKLLRGAAAPDRRAEEQFLDEARRLARLRHPHVLMVHGADRHEGRAGLWTDLLEGQTLEHLLTSQGPLGPREASAIGLDLCSALAAVHGSGVVHRDVKTENVMREKGGRIVLMDLGCGVEIPPGERSHQSTTIRGTPVAMAPEQLEGRTAGPPTDLYGLGVLLYRLVTGRYPIEAPTFAELVRKHAEGGLVGLRDRRPDLPAGFVRVIEKAIDPDPAQRFQTAGEMERALAEAAGLHFSAEVGPTPAHAPVAPKPTVTRWWIAAAAAVVLLIGAGWIVARWVRPDSGVRPAGQAHVESQTAGSPPAARLTMNASLFRERPGVHERLQAGGTVAPGDGLFLEVEGSEDFHAYVLNEDREGRMFVLFPAPAFQIRNPLAGRKVHRLPGTRDGRLVNWQVTSAGGEERVVVIASRGPLEDLERRIAALPHPETGAPVAYGELNTESAGDLYRAIGGVTESPPAAGPAPARRLEEILAAFGNAADRRPDLAVWLIELSNPGR